MEKKRLTIIKRTIDAPPKATYYLVKYKEEELGLITKEHWHRWTWEQNEGIIMSRGCLKEVVEFMETLGGKD